MKKVCFTIAALLMLTACSFGEKSQKNAEDTDVCKNFTGVIARERYANSSYGRVGRKYVLFEDGKTMKFSEPYPELVLAEPGDTLVFRLDDGRFQDGCWYFSSETEVKVKFKL